MVSFTYEEFTLFIESISGFKSKRQMLTQFNKIQRLVENKKNFTSKDIMKIFKLSTLKKPSNCWHLFIESVSKDFEPGLDGKAINKQASLLWQKLSDKERQPFIDASKLQSERYHSLKAELSESFESSDEDVNDILNDEIDVQPKRIKSNSNKKYDEEFWEDLEELNWTRYENDREFWEYAINDEKYIIREGNSKKTKIHDRIMKSDKAVQRTIAKNIDKKESDGFTMV